MFTVDPKSSAFSQVAMASQYETGVGEAFLAGAADALNTTSPALLGDVMDYHQAAKRGSVLTKDEWEISPWHREGLKFTDGMTADLAELLAQRHDRNTTRSFVYDKASTAGKAAFYAAEFIGSIPDPLNFLPIARMTGIAGVMKKGLGETAAIVLSGTVDAVAGVGVLQPGLAYTSDLYQEPFDMSMAAMNMLVAGAIGTGAGALSARFVSYERRMEAVSKAIADKMEGRPVDVGPVLNDTGQATIPSVVKTPDEVKELFSGYQRTLAQVDELEAQIGGADAATQPALIEARDALLRQADEQAWELGATQKMDHSVPPRPPSDFPQVDPTTPANAYTPAAGDEVDMSTWQRRFAEAEAEGRLPADTADTLTLAAEETKKASKIAKAYEIGATCLMRG